MRRLFPSMLIVILLSTSALVAWPPPPVVTYESPVKCSHNHGRRLTPKTDRTEPPPSIPDDQKVRVADIADLPVPDEEFDKDTPRSGYENKWYELTGRVVLVRAEG